jgi:hypothetical protein
MNIGPLSKVAARTATEVCRGFPLGAEVRGLLRDDLTPGAFLDRLLEAGRFPEAVRFLAHALPKREAVWWACLCARRAAGPKPNPEALAALQATEKWVAAPTDENRRAAQTAAETADVGTPAGCVAFAAFLSGGSLAPPGLPEVPPGETLTAAAASGAVLMSVVAAEPEKAGEKYRAVLALGVEVAKGTNRWKEGA